MAQVKDEVQNNLLETDFAGTAKLSRDLNAMLNWKSMLDERIGSLEMDMRSEDGILFSMIQECKSLAASGDAGSFTIAGYTMQNEKSVLAMIQPLSHKNNYAVFCNLNMLLSLCGNDAVSLEGNMLLHKAAKGADFELPCCLVSSGLRSQIHLWQYHQDDLESRIQVSRCFCRRDEVWRQDCN
jgi:hypothetical protein